jgi:hypothetical protein
LITAPGKCPTAVSLVAGTGFEPATSGAMSYAPGVFLCPCRPKTQLNGGRVSSRFHRVALSTASEGWCRWPEVQHRRDEPCSVDFPNNFVGDLVYTDHGWVIVPPAGCQSGDDYCDPGWSVSSVWCSCNDRHLAWRRWNWALFHCATAHFALAAA